MWFFSVKHFQKKNAFLLSPFLSCSAWFLVLNITHGSDSYRRLKNELDSVQCLALLDPRKPWNKRRASLNSTVIKSQPSKSPHRVWCTSILGGKSNCLVLGLCLERDRQKLPTDCLLSSLYTTCLAFIPLVCVPDLQLLHFIWEIWAPSKDLKENQFPLEEKKSDMF